jgi:hypothetical protein
MIPRSILPRAGAALLLVSAAVILPAHWARSDDRSTQDRLDRVEQQLIILQQEIKYLINIKAGSRSADVEQRVDGLEEKVRELTGEVKDAVIGVRATSAAPQSNQ